MERLECALGVLCLVFESARISRNPDILVCVVAMMLICYSTDHTLFFETTVTLSLELTFRVYVVLDEGHVAIGYGLPQRPMLSPCGLSDKHQR